MGLGSALISASDGRPLRRPAPRPHNGATAGARGWATTNLDVQRARDALKNDTFFKTRKPWQKAMSELLEMGVRAEQQALAKWGLNYVIDEYLPRKLVNPAQFLP